MEEIWKLIEGYDHECYISNKGRVRSHKGNILSFINFKDILRITLKCGGKQRRTAVHRLVAHYFLGLDLKDKTSTAKHIDGDIYNNTVENLKVVKIACEATLKKQEDTKSGMANVSWYPPLGKWKVAYRYRRKKKIFFKHIGYFHSLEDAKNINSNWFNSFKKIVPKVKYPGLLYLEGEKKWRVDVFDYEGNLYHIDNYEDEKEALKEWKLFTEVLSRKH